VRAYYKRNNLRSNEVLRFVGRNSLTIFQAETAFPLINMRALASQLSGTEAVS
jgi:uncharacterized membrane protein YcfT